MRFQVPQFIEVEDVIFGPFSFRQFVYILGGAGISYIIFQFVPHPFLAILLIVPVAGLALALAFFRFNGRPFISTLEAAFHYFKKGKKYMWKKSEPKSQGLAQRAEAKESSYAPITVPHLSESRLKDLTWSLGLKDNVNTKPDKKQ
jgi:hypothetical protein